MIGSLVEINTFDDGNEPYRAYRNSWRVTSVWRGKVGLANTTSPDVVISSISAWKVRLLEGKGIN